MKKLLAMVLALVMTLSLAVSANAFTDDKSISDDYAEAVAVLNGMGVFKGYEDGSFKPEGNITRAEVATIIYRIYTADVAKNDKSGLYATYNKFSDMAGASWAAGYIGYCANASLVKGYPDGTFKPSGNVTGYEVLAMILRAVGYDKNNEFSGSDWALHVAQTAQQLGVLDNVAKTTDLNAPASRELVAELLFQGIQKAQVTYTPAFGYVTDKVIGTKNNSLGEKNFKLASAADSDKWGRPATTWTYTTGDKSTTFVEKPDVSYTVATTECDIAHDIGLKKDATFTLYTNGAKNSSNYVVQPLDTVQKLGAQGTLLEVYTDAKVVVAIDTFLAKVTDVKDATYDAQGHLKAPSMITMTVYGNTEQNVVLTNGDENYGYVKGDYVLVNAYTKDSVNTATGVVTGGDIDTTATTVATYGSQPVAEYAEIVGKADSITGAQTFLWYNNLKHTVNGTNYDDAKWFKLDEAGTETTNHTWFFDSYGNLIGAVDIDTQYAYGIIENIQWQNPAMATGYAQATIRYMDGTTETKVVSKINNKTLTYTTNGTNPNFTDSTDSATATVSTSLGENAPYCGNDLYRIETAADGTVALKHVFTKASAAAAEVKSHLDRATIKTGIAAIQGTEGNATKAIYVNSNTTFLVRTGTFATGFTYTVVKGFENVGNYTGSATVDYVNLDGDLYADYVFVTGDADAATGKQMFYLTSSNVQAVLKTNNIKYYVLTGIVDGVPGTIEVKYNTALGSTATALSDSNVAQWAAENVNKMFTIQYQDSQIVNIWGPKADIADLGSEIGTTAYANLALAYTATTAADDSWDGEVLAIGNAKYNVVGLTPVYGEFASDMSNKSVYVVYDKSVTVAGAYVAKAVYIANLGDKGTDGTVTPNTTGTIIRTVQVYQGGTLIATKSVTQYKIAAGTYTSGQDYATVSSVLPELAVAGATVVVDAPASVVVTADNTTVVNYIVRVD